MIGEETVWLGGEKQLRLDAWLVTGKELACFGTNVLISQDNRGNVSSLVGSETETFSLENL